MRRQIRLPVTQDSEAAHVLLNMMFAYLEARIEETDLSGEESLDESRLTSENPRDEEGE